MPRVQGEPVLAAAEEEGRERARAPGERTGAGAGCPVRRAQHVRNLGGNLMVFWFLLKYYFAIILDNTII